MLTATATSSTCGGLFLQADLKLLVEDDNVQRCFIDTLDANGVLSVQEFADLEHDRGHMRAVLTGPFGLPTTTIQELNPMRRILNVWESSQKPVSERVLVSSQCEAHGETVKMRRFDSLVHVGALNTARGLDLLDERLPGVHGQASGGRRALP